MVPGEQVALINISIMKKIVLIIACFLSVNRLSAQKIDGLWYSSDSTRVYEIKKSSENKYTAVIKSSTRQADSAGYVVIKDLEYNSRRRRYEGIIYSVKDGDATFVKIKFLDTNKLSLKLSRMFVFDVVLKWIRVEV